jgi:hypothetical protein
MSKKAYFKGLNLSKKNETNANVAVDANTAPPPPPVNARNIYDHLDALKTSMKESQSSTMEHVEQMKQLQLFNEKLSKSYLNNLQTMVDVATLLNELHAFLKVVKGAFDEITTDITGVSKTDIAYLDDLTGEQIKSLHEKFKSDVGNMRFIFSEFNQLDKVKQLEETNTSMGNMIISAESLKNTKRGGQPKKKKNLSNTHVIDKHGCCEKEKRKKAKGAGSGAGRTAATASPANSNTRKTKSKGRLPK